jgi:RNA polymerase sigma-70 factor (ECF subfamily)
VRDPTLAEDAAQEAFLRVFRSLDRFQPRSSFRAWVRTIAIRCAIDQLRRRRPEFPMPEEQAATGSEEARLLDADLLRAALAALSPIDREILISREVEGASDREIAGRLAMRVTAIRVRAHRARRRIRALFRETPS